MILCINIDLEPVKVDIKRTQTKNKTVQKHSNDKIQFTFFCLPNGRWMNGPKTVTHWEHMGAHLRGVFL